MLTEIYGDLELVTAPVAYPLTLDDELRVALGLNTSAWDDYISNTLIPETTDYVEGEILGGRQLMLATYDQPLAGFWSGPLQLPLPPLNSVTSLKYYNDSGTLTTVTSSDYLVRTPLRQPGTIEPAPGVTWSYVTQNDRRLPVVIRFVAGYASAALVPSQAKSIMRLALLWKLQRREANAEELKAVERLCNQLGWGFYG